MDGGPAFPREDYQADDAPGQRGMSLRDYFAGQALLVLVDNPPKNTEIKEWIRERVTYAFIYADAMIAAREVQS